MSPQQDNPKSYNCSDVERLAQRYVDSDLSEEEQKLFDAHLEYCLPCDKKIQLEIKLKEIVRVKAKQNVSSSFTSSKIKSLLSSLS